MKNRLKVQGSRFKVLFLAGVIILFVSLLYAEGRYPEPQEKYVNDFAGILTATDRNTLGEMMKNLENKTGIEMSVVTVKTIGDYPTGDTDVESFAGGLFNTWEIGKNKGNNGVMMLVSRDDRKMRIVLGEQYVFIYELIMQKVIEKKMLPFFKDGYYSRGIYEGAREIISKLTRKVSFFEFYWKEITGGLLGVIIIIFGFFIKRPPTGRNAKSHEKAIPFGGGASGSWG